MLSPDLIDILDRFKIDIMSSLNCVGIGIVEKIDNQKKVAQLSMAYKAKRTGVDGEGNEFDEPVDYPALVDCPVFSVSGGKAGLYVPIEIGDTAIILFNDVDIDNYFSSKNVAVPDSDRLHSFSDAIAIVGIQNSIKNFGTDIALYNDGASLAIGGNKFEIKNSSQNLLGIISELLDIIKALAPIEIPPSGTPQPCSPNPVDTVKIEALRVKVQGLLK